MGIFSQLERAIGLKTKRRRKSKHTRMARRKDGRFKKRR